MAQLGYVTIAIFANLIVLASGKEMTSIPNYDNYNFDTYLTEFAKSYASSIHVIRRKAFEFNLAEIHTQNKRYRSGQSSWFAGVNEFTDMSREDFMRMSNMPSAPRKQNVSPPLAVTANPDSIDWRQKGAVTEVRSQQCGDCWANGAIETVESRYQIATGILKNLSAQAYVNCVKNPNQCGGKGGCEGATFELAYNLTITQGVPTLETLPYGGGDQACKPYKAAVRATGFVDIPSNDAKTFETALAQGPLSVTVAAGSWQSYRGGIMDTCAYGLLRPWLGLTLNHGVQAVGYTQEYWIVRNSWGRGWGMGGYIHLSRKHDNATWPDFHTADGVACKPYPKKQTVGGECGILSYASYPTGVTNADEQMIV